MKESVKTRPNLFRYAPRELSQDAFFAWLFEWLNFPMTELCDLAKQFVNSVLDVKVDWKRFEKVVLRSQWKGIDILAILHFREESPLVLVVEDKIQACLHNPLEEYLKRVMENLPELGLPPTLPKERLKAFVVKPLFRLA